MTKERQLLHAWLCITPHIVDPMYEKIRKTTKELLAQPKREPLSLTEIQRIWDENAESGTRENFVRAIEKVHGIGE